MSELGEVILSIPPITRTIVLTSVVMSGMNALGLVPYNEFMCFFPLVWQKFEFYRLLTGFLIPSPQPMQGLMEIYMLYTFAKGLETGKFKRNTPDFLYYMMLILPIMLIAAYLFLPAVLSLSPALQAALTFTWSIANYYQQVNFYFMPIKASLLPAVSLGFRLLVDGQQSFILSLIGMIAAYFYNCIETHSFGPLASVFSTTDPSSNNATRLGTGNNFSQWYYSTGELSAPAWLQSAVSSLTGVNYTNPPLNRGGLATGGYTAQPGRKLGGKSTDTTSKSTGTAPKPAPEPVFRGKGQRLGSIN